MVFLRLIVVFSLVGLMGCRSTTPVSNVDLTAPGWEVRQGQAIWMPGEGKPEIVGDVIVSTHPSGSASVQFSKTLPLVSGRVAPHRWEFEVPAEQRRYSGRGRPPKRLVWLQMLRALEGETVPDRWRVIRPSEQFIALENVHSGERLEVQFFP